MRVSADDARDFIAAVLQAEGVSQEPSKTVADGLVHASLRGVDSHGIRLLPHYLEELSAGRVNADPDSDLNITGSSTAIFDADHGFGHWAGMRGAKVAADLAEENGTSFVAVKNSNHFGACSYYSIELAKNNMIGIVMTHSDQLVVPTNGVRAFLGNNPISIAAPCSDEEPVCLDMATSKVTFNEILKRREEGIDAPAKSGVDAEGQETTDPEEIEYLLPVGGYKGYGLGIMIEILCSLLTDMDYGPNLTKMYDDPLEEQRQLGHAFIAIDINRFSHVNAFEKRIQNLIDELRSEPATEGDEVQVPGDPEKGIKMDRLSSGIPLRETDYDQFESLAERHSIALPLKPN